MDEFTRCSVCSRTPLVGEGVSVTLQDSRESVVCDLCLESPRAAILGEPVRRDRVRTAAGASHVRRVWPAPAREPTRPAVAR